MVRSVSVIVPTFNTDPGRLDTLIRSFDAQTMPADEREIVFVDDGSTTDIYAELQSLAESRDDIRVERIENSRGPCRPRNIGIDAAAGDYVLFMDHDDVLFPDGLRQAYLAAGQSGADIVSAKEARNKELSWGWTRFSENDPAAHTDGIRSLLPMTPHKLFKRSFLEDNDIKFIEEPGLLWEDVYFNVAAYSCGATIAVFADYPLYHWVRTGVNTSTSFEKDQRNRWDQVNRLFEYITATLPSGDDYDFLIRHWYKSRILNSLKAPLFAKKEERIAFTFDAAAATATKWVPERLDETLRFSHRAGAGFEILESGVSQ